LRLWDNVEKYCRVDTPWLILWPMCIACWIPKAINTHSEYVILIGFPLQELWQEGASLLQDMRCSLTQQWGAVVQPILLWKINNYYVFWERKGDKYYIFWVWVSSLNYPACNWHAQYCHMWPVRLYNIFPIYLINGTILGKNLIEHKTCVLIFPITFLIYKEVNKILLNVFSLHFWHHTKCMFAVHYLLLYMLMTCWCKFAEDGDNTETCRSSVNERIRRM
jgi:hypothetical protein